MRISWLVRTVDSEAYLREYNTVGVRWCMYSCNCTWIYVGKLNTLNRIMSLQWPNNWQPNTFHEQNQYTIISTGTPGGLECRTSTDCVCIICISFPWPAQRPGLSPFYDLYDPNVSSSLGHGVPATVILSLAHTTPILLTKTKVYGYNF